MNGMTKRQSNIELLRIIAIIMIIGNHFAVHGVIQDYGTHPYLEFSTGTFINKVFVLSLIPGGIAGMGCFFIITGYFMIDTYNTIGKRILRLFLEAVFYGMLILLISVILSFVFKVDGNVNFSSMVRSILWPISSQNWWFLSSYVLLLLISPLINKIIMAVNEKNLLLFCVVAWIAFFSVPYIIGSAGYNYVEAIFWYIIGASIRRRNTLEKVQKNTIIMLLLFICSCIAFLSLNYLSVENPSKKMEIVNKLIGVPIIIPIATISLFMFFLNLKFYSNTINSIAKSVFGVYLMHDFQFTRMLFWNGIINPCRYINKIYYPLFVWGLILIIFSTLTLIDFLRRKIIEPVAMRYTYSFYNFLIEK
jgi:surface polysaccharide O-acyltransferase-like enzyme